MRVTNAAAAALLLGLGLTLGACAEMGMGPEPAAGPGPIGTERQPTASPDEVQDEAPQAQEPGGGPIQ